MITSVSYFFGMRRVRKREKKRNQDRFPTFIGVNLERWQNKKYKNGGKRSALLPRHRDASEVV